MSLKRSLSWRRKSSMGHGHLSGCHAEEYFHEQLDLERKRSERSKRQLLVMTIDFEGIQDRNHKNAAIKKVLKSITMVTRSTDIKGWYKHSEVLGIIFTEMSHSFELHVLQNKIVQCLHTNLSSEQFEALHTQFHPFQENQVTDEKSTAIPALFYPDVLKKKQFRMMSHVAKRSMDIAGSLTGILMLSPLFLLIPLGIKLTSKGPVLFRQERVGQSGKKFTFLKFRSMYVDNDSSAHKQFVHDLISGDSSGEIDSKGRTVYKITKDKRITPFGHILRKTSMDELPQFFNVLFGSMSLVGPRPPIPYETEKYAMWHQSRIMVVKPGITGLWQVGGRSSTTFDEMVRLDIKYSNDWTVWIDIKILLKTPLAIFKGSGAY